MQSSDGSWIDVSIPRDHVALMPGYTLEYALGGLVPATQHRVVRADGLGDMLLLRGPLCTTGMQDCDAMLCELGLNKIK